MKRQLALIAIIILLSSCAAHVHPVELNNPCGFWMGLWHGIISPITFVISIFSDTITVWDINNNGNWYTLGFLLGVGTLTGGGTYSSTNN